MSKSTTARAKSKAIKPHAGYPLTAHRNGSWCKKIRSTRYPKGKVIYFGPLHDPQAALNLWLKEKDELLAGHDPVDVRNRSRSVSASVTVKDAIDAYLTTKEQHADAGQITRRHFGDLQAIGTLLADLMGRTKAVESLKPQDFGAVRAALSDRYGPTALLRTMICIRSVFKHAAENGLIATPVRYGSLFSLPTKKDLRLQRASKPERLFAAADLRKLIGAAGPQMKAMILLGCNCGLGNSDCGNLEFRHLDLDGAWLNFPRPKTGVDRRAKLWPESIDAIKAATVKRPTPTHSEHADRVFVTKYRESFAKDDRNNPISVEFKKLLDEHKLHQEGIGFCTLRCVFESIGGGSRDQVTVDAVMGHCDESMAARYRAKMFDDRLEAVADYVRNWLFADAKPAQSRAPRKPR